MDSVFQFCEDNDASMAQLEQRTTHSRTRRQRSSSSSSRSSSSSMQPPTKRQRYFERMASDSAQEDDDDPDDDDDDDDESEDSDDTERGVPDTTHSQRPPPPRRRRRRQERQEEKKEDDGDDDDELDLIRDRTLADEFQDVFRAEEQNYHGSEPLDTSYCFMCDVLGQLDSRDEGYPDIHDAIACFMRSPSITSLMTIQKRYNDVRDRDNCRHVFQYWSLRSIHRHVYQDLFVPDFMLQNAARHYHSAADKIGSEFSHTPSGEISVNTERLRLRERFTKNMIAAIVAWMRLQSARGSGNNASFPR